MTPEYKQVRLLQYTEPSFIKYATVPQLKEALHKLNELGFYNDFSKPHRLRAELVAELEVIRKNNKERKSK